MNAPLASGSARHRHNVIEHVHVAAFEGGWRLSLHLRPEAAAASAAGVEHVVVQGLDADCVPLQVVRLHSPDGEPGCLEVLLRSAHGEAPAVGAAYSVRLLGWPGLDDAPAAARFVLDGEAGGDIDPRPPVPAPAPLPPAAEINYLAKDYASFRQLLMEQMNLLAPQWQQANPADLGVTMIETLAYAADYLSYQQDAVATEAYLATARRRSSLKRHSRLLGYAVQDGCNARVWVHVEVDADHVPLPAGTPILTAVRAGERRLPASMKTALLGMHLGGSKVFETMHDALLSEPFNRIHLHTGGKAEHALPAGSTSALLHAPLLALVPGQVLQFEAVARSEEGELLEADPRHRHTVRLTQVHQLVEAGEALTHVVWDNDDALPFTLTVSRRTPNGATHGSLAVARGNIVLADCGVTLARQKLAPAGTGPYRPVLTHPGLTYREPLTAQAGSGGSARAALRQSMGQVLPAISLAGEQPLADPAEAKLAWSARRDLLDSDRFACDFTVDAESDGSAVLRFGDGRLGRAPAAGTVFYADYRLGNGVTCNIGAELLAHIVSDDGRIVRVRNLMPAAGGCDPESAASIRFNAPDACLAPARAVTADDYRLRAQSCDGVGKAAAELRWTGSWHSAFVYVAPDGGGQLAPLLRQRVLAHLDSWRLAGCDVKVLPARHVALDIVLSVQVHPDFFKAAVHGALMRLFGRGQLADGGVALFAPERFDFGQSLYLSQLLAAAAAQPGVLRVDTVRFQRFGQAARGELAAGRIDVGPHQIVRLDNDPAAPHYGTLRLIMKGGA